MNSAKLDRNTELLKAWEAGLKENSSNPHVRKKLGIIKNPLSPGGRGGTL